MIDKNVDLEEEKIVSMIEEVAELVPDAFNMKSSKVGVLFGEEHNRLWDNIYEVFEGKVPREKIDSFKNGYGTVLYFVDGDIVENMQGQFEAYSENFPVWANQASGMLQISIWTGLRELGLGASLQHYNPVIDNMVKEMLDIPSSYNLLAQMPFGNIVGEVEDKEKEDISERVKIYK